MAQAAPGTERIDTMIRTVAFILASVFGYVIHVGPPAYNHAETMRMCKADRKSAHDFKPVWGKPKGED